MNLSERVGTMAEGGEYVENSRVTALATSASAAIARFDALFVLAGAALIVSGFFAPWMSGSGPFEYRSFSGADFARLIRNFEITTDATTSSLQIRGSAVAMYMAPALAVNAAVARLMLIAAAPKQWATWSTRIAGVYALVVLTLILALSVLPINEFAPSVGMPSWGFALTLAGATGLLIAGMRPGAGR